MRRPQIANTRTVAARGGDGGHGAFKIDFDAGRNPLDTVDEPAKAGKQTGGEYRGQECGKDALYVKVLQNNHFQRAVPADRVLCSEEREIARDGYNGCENIQRVRFSENFLRVAVGDRKKDIDRHEPECRLIDEGKYVKYRAAPHGFDPVFHCGNGHVHEHERKAAHRKDGNQHDETLADTV